MTLSHEDFQQVYTIWCGELNPATLLGTCRYVGAPGRAGPTPASPGTATTLITTIDQERTDAAIFGHAEFDLSDRLNLTIGARLSHENNKGSGEGLHIFDDGVRALNNRDGLGLASGSNTINELTPSGNISLSYETRAGLVYASLSNSFKSGGFNGEVQNNAAHFSDEGLFESETVTAFEVGFKSADNNALRYDLAAFYQEYQDPQARIFVNFPLPDGTSITSNSLSNLDEAASFGVEANLDWQVSEAFSLSAAAIYNDTEIKQTTDIGGNAATFDGNPLPFAPEVSATLGGNFNFDVTDEVAARLSAHAKYRDDYFLDAEGLDDRKQDSFTTLQANLDLIFDDGAHTLSLWGRNLTDEDYAVSGFGFIGYNTFRSDPRTFGASYRRAF